MYKFQFSLQTLGMLSLLSNKLSYIHEVVSYCGFNLHFLDHNRIENILCLLTLGYPFF